MEEELAALRTENARLRALLGMDRTEDHPAGPWRPMLFTEEMPTANRRPVDHSATREEKVALYRSLFVGRDDVYAARWANERTGKAGWSPQVEGGWANAS